MTISDFSALHALISQMADWDAQMTRDAGFPPEAVYAAYYGNGADQLHETLTAPGAIMLLASDGEMLLGCLGFAPFADGTAELEKFYVDPRARGRGIGQALLGELLPRMSAALYRHACLETAFFMTGALALYARAGFRPCTPFRAPPAGLEGLSVFLDRAL
jgi:GNAT superfamily N-acetyltransferase